MGLNLANMEAAPVDLSKMKVADLKKELKARGLSVEGKKNELQERLQEALEADGTAIGPQDEDLDEEAEEALLSGKAAPAKAAAKRPAPAAVESKPDEEKTAQEKRAERFGVPLNDNALKSARAARFGIEEKAPKTAGSNKRAPKLDMTTGGTDVEKLKARSERFGEVTSKTLKKIEVLEKKKERADRFKNGEVIVPETNGVDKPAVEKSGEKTPITLGDSKGAEIKKKRAERFAAK